MNIQIAHVGPIAIVTLNRPERRNALSLELLLTGELVPARTAAEWGLINQAVPAAELQSATRGLAEKVAAASSLVVAIGKQDCHTQINLDQQKAYAYASEVMWMNALAAGAQEGTRVFLGKRAPCWSAGTATGGDTPKCVFLRAPSACARNSALELRSKKLADPILYRPSDRCAPYS